ncbi:MAG: glycosyl hydrolase [Bacteroidota bacterium]
MKYIISIGLLFCVVFQSQSRSRESVTMDISSAGNIYQITPKLVDPDATGETKAMYEFLKLQFRQRIISGQTHDYHQQLVTLTGKTPLLRVGDFQHFTEGYPYLWRDGGHTFGKSDDGSVDQLIEWYNNTGKRGIISYQWHWHSPTGGDAGTNTFYTSLTTFDVTKAVIPGTQEYEDIITDIDDISAELKRFQDAGIPVLWRPLHEAGGGWFWWGAKGAEACKELYNIMFDRMKNHHGLHNLIWVWSTPEEDWYPGNHMVDIIGHDSYPGNYNYGNQKYAFDALFQLTGGEKLIAMTENGPIPDPNNCLQLDAPWLYFMSWSDLVTEQNTLEHIRDVYDNPNVLSVESNNTVTDNEWRSTLYPENWKPGFRDAKGRFLHDFSYAGYHGGNKPVPHITENIVDVTLAPYHADHTGVADATGILQQALNDVGRSGGGVVFLPSGTYRIKIPAGANHALVISHDHTLLRGAGPDSTFLFHDETYMRFKDVIYVSGGYSSWFIPQGTTSNIRVDLNMPTRVIPVKSIAGFQTGDQVIINSLPTDGFIEEHGMAGIWTMSAIKGVAFKRRIDSIDAIRNLLILDAPTRYSLKRRDMARVYHAKDHLEECGIENLSIGNRENPKSGWDEESYATSGTGAFDVHFSHAIKVEYSENCWVKNVHTYRPGVNSQEMHLLSNCLLLNMCRHITVDSCDFQKPQYEGGGGNGYMYTLQSNDCLIKNSRANHSRHNYDFKYPYSNGNVIYNCRGENSKYSSDFHMYLSMSNLFDKCTIDGDYLESMFRPYGGPIHGYSSTQSVFYNTTGENYHPDRDYIVDSRQYKWGYVVGTSGPAYKVKTDPVSGIFNGYTFDTSPRDFVEGVGEGANLRPQSLYLDQLEKRENDTLKLHFYKVEVIAINSETGEPLPGCEIAIYEASQLTGGSGSTVFQKVPEMFILNAKKEYFLPYGQREMVIYSDTVLTIQLAEKNFNVTMILLDALSINPFRGVSVTLDGSIEVTNEEGKAHFNVSAGKKEYSFRKISYQADSGTIEVTSDTVIQFLLIRTHADVKFWMKEGTTPVNNVVVTVGDSSLISTALGLTTFRQLPIDEAYHFTAIKEGYELNEGDFNLTTDTAIYLSMERITTVNSILDHSEGFRIWPNPANEILYCNIPDDLRIISLKITDMMGRVIQTQKIEGDLIRINLENYPPGAYLIIPVGDRIEEPLFFTKQ